MERRVAKMKADLQDSTAALFDAAVDAAVAADVDCRFAYSRCLELKASPGPALEQAKEDLARAVRSWLERTVGDLEAQVAPKAEPQPCDCGAKRAGTTHAEWCATKGEVVSVPGRQHAEPRATGDLRQENEALRKGIERYRRKAERLEAELAECQRWVADVHATAAKKGAVAALRAEVRDLKAQLGARGERLHVNDKPDPRTYPTYEYRPPAFKSAPPDEPGGFVPRSTREIFGK